MKATTKITCKELRELWEKAVTYSRLEKEYASRWLKVDKPWWKVWEKTQHTSPPIETDGEYWDYMRGFYPWNEIDGFSSISKYQDDRVLTISVKLLAAVVNRAKKYDQLFGE